MSKVVFVTGGATGIGAATIERLLRENLKVAFLDRNESAGLEVSKRLGTDQVIFMYL